MAGSYSYIVDADGGLMDRDGIKRSLHSDEITLECIEELYGMIWFLADALVYAQRPDTTKDVWMHRADQVKVAQDNATEGLLFSPTERFQPFDEGRYEGESIEFIVNGFVVATGESREFLTKLIENRIKKAKEEGV